MGKYKTIEDLKGLKIVQIDYNDDELNFVVLDGDEYHSLSLSGDDGPPNDCQVWLESVVGDINDLIGEELLKVEIATNKNDTIDKYGNENYGTWTFYKFATRKGYVDIRFCGNSNGYYCEEAVLHHLGKIIKR